MKSGKAKKLKSKNLFEAFKKKAYAFYRKNRKAIYKEIWKNQLGILLATEDLEDPLRTNQYYLKLSNLNWSLAAEYKQLEIAFIKTGFIEDNHSKKLNQSLLNSLPDLHKKIWPRYFKYYWYKQVRKSEGKIIKVKPSAAMLELLLRGFRPIEEVSWAESKPYTVRTSFDLVWPESFGSHQEAIEKMNAMGIPQYCHTLIPEDKFYDRMKRKFTSRGHHTIGFNIN